MPTAPGATDPNDPSAQIVSIPSSDAVAAQAQMGASLPPDDDDVTPEQLAAMEQAYFSPAPAAPAQPDAAPAQQPTELVYQIPLPADPAQAPQAQQPAAAPPPETPAAGSQFPQYRIEGKDEGGRVVPPAQPKALPDVLVSAHLHDAPVEGHDEFRDEHQHEQAVR